MTKIREGLKLAKVRFSYEEGYIIAEIDQFAVVYRE